MTRRGRPVAGAVAVGILVLAALAAAGWWWTAARSDVVLDARARDAALVGARDAAVTLNSFERRDPEAAVEAWMAVSSGGLRKELADSREVLARHVKASAFDGTARVAEIALQSLDADRKRAVALVGLDVTSGESVVEERLVVTVVRTSRGWLAVSMEGVAR